jgi:hypothetical protein
MVLGAGLKKSRKAEGHAERARGSCGGDGFDERASSVRHPICLRPRLVRSRALKGTAQSSRLAWPVM